MLRALRTVVLLIVLCLSFVVIAGLCDSFWLATSRGIVIKGGH